MPSVPLFPPFMTPTDDAALVRGSADGDPRSLAALYDRHADRVYSLVLAMVGGAADAEEVTEDVFIQIWETADRFDPDRGAVSSWITTVARTRALDHLRSRRRRAQRLETSAARDPDGTSLPMGRAGPDPWSHTEQEALARRLGDALDRLPEEQRAVIRLAYFGGLSRSEIAATLEQPLGTVKSRTRLGMQALRDLVVPEGEATP